MRRHRAGRGVNSLRRGDYRHRFSMTPKGNFIRWRIMPGLRNLYRRQMLLSLTLPHAHWRDFSIVTASPSSYYSTARDADGDVRRGATSEEYGIEAVNGAAAFDGRARAPRIEAAIREARCCRLCVGIDKSIIGVNDFVAADFGREILFCCAQVEPSSHENYHQRGRRKISPTLGQVE